MFAPDISLDDDRFYNDVELTCTGGTKQVARDASSITNYGIATLSHGGALLTSDIDVLSLAQLQLLRYCKPVTRFRGMTVKPQAPGYETLLWPQALGREISDRITVIRAEAGIGGDYHIEGISHSWDYRVGEWQTQWTLSDAETFLLWILGQAGYSELGLTTRLCW
jgi:hypothetical protein